MAAIVNIGNDKLVRPTSRQVGDNNDRWIQSDSVYRGRYCSGVIYTYMHGITRWIRMISVNISLYENTRIYDVVSTVIM